MFGVLCSYPSLGAIPYLQLDDVLASDGNLWQIWVERELLPEQKHKEWGLGSLLAGISESLVALSLSTGLAVCVTPSAPGIDVRSPFNQLRIVVIIKVCLPGSVILKEALIGSSGQLSLTD